jgi:hypothetical protein
LVTAVLKILCEFPDTQGGTTRDFDGSEPSRAGQQVRQLDSTQEQSMKKYLIPIVAVVALGTATPVMAFDAGSLVSMQDAVDVATDIGLVTVSHTQFEGDKWFIQGRDRSGQYMEMAVSATSGDVLWVNR